MGGLCEWASQAPGRDAQKDAQRTFTTDPHGLPGPLLPPPGGQHQERPRPGSATPSPTPGQPPRVTHPVTHPGSATPGHPPQVTHPITHPESPTSGQPPHHPPRVSHPGSPTLGNNTRRDPTPGHPPWVAPSCLLGKCPVASLKHRGEEPGQEVTSGTCTHWTCRAWLHVPHSRSWPQECAPDHMGPPLMTSWRAMEPTTLVGPGAWGRQGAGGRFGGAGSLLWVEGSLTPGPRSERPCVPGAWAPAREHPDTRDHLPSCSCPRRGPASC